MNTDFFGPSAERNSWFGGLNAGVKCVVTVVLILAAILIKDPVSATVMLVLELVGFTVVGFRPHCPRRRSSSVLPATLKRAAR